MLTHRATATNAAGLRFAFTFWGDGSDKTAQAALDKIVAGDALHLANGPWTASGINRERTNHAPSEHGDSK